MSVSKDLHLGPSERRERKRRLFYIRSGIILFFIFLLVFGMAILSGHDKVKIKTIIVSGNAAVSADNVLAIANQAMTGRYGYLFARNNFLIFPRYQIKRDLFREIKTIKEVNISWQKWQEISIAITERKPHSVWCNALQPADKCYFADRTGYIYSVAPTFSGGLYVKNYSTLSTSTSPLGQNFLTPSLYYDLYQVIDILEENGLKIVSLAYDNYSYKFTLGSGPEIIFNTTWGLEKPFNNLLTAVKSGDLNLEAEAELLNYIDLRFEGKIVIGRKNQNEN